MDSRHEFKLRKIIRELTEKRGRHTELISVYVPKDYDMNKILAQLQSEQGTASNIKSTATRKNVVDALEKTIQYLRLYKSTPPNGLALFCGNISEREGVQDLKLWAIEPPEPISTRLYRCDQTFITEPLEALIAPKDVYGLIAIDNKTATIATLKGTRYNVIKELTSGYHGKHRAGGQSQRRFERMIDEQSHEFKVRVASVAEDAFLPNILDLRGIVIGGPASTKDDFVKGDYLHHELRKKIIAVKDITYTDESGIRELVEAAKDDLSSVEMVRHKKLMQRFFQGLVSDSPPIAYGPSVDVALEAKAVDVLMLSTLLDDKVIEDLYVKANSANSDVEVVSDEFEEGFQLSKTFGGKAAILRFRIS